MVEVVLSLCAVFVTAIRSEQAETSSPVTAPAPTWVPDPSAGHYDCPEGWMHYAPAEPQVYHEMPSSMHLPYFEPPRVTRDAKGHVLGTPPAPGICVKEAAK